MLQYRREVDGLRAVAIIPVLLFHAAPSLVPGGFIGVDIFFVISGYLITSIVMADLAAGNFSISNFYQRRIRRIFPALFLVAVCCIPLTWFVLTPRDMKGLSESLIATTLFVSNIFFWSKSGYFDTAAELKPLLHTWSLAVEEQFYLFFPWFLIAAWRWKPRRITAALGVLIAASLLSAELGSRIHPTANFYLLHSRAWELLAGAAVAMFLGIGRVQALAETGSANIKSGVGAALIAWAVFGFDATMPWPSLYTVIPVTGTTLILLYATPSTLVGQVLATNPLVGIGLVSYSAYLWHQPLLAVVKYQSAGHPAAATLALVVLLTLVLAYATWRLLEVPIRKGQPRAARQTFALFLIGSIVLVALGIAGRKTDGFENLRLTDAKQRQFKAMMERRFAQCFTDKMGKDSPVIHASDLCRIGNTTSTASFIVYGDSHAVSLASAFDAAATLEGKSGLLIATSACPPLVNAAPGGQGRIKQLCVSMNQTIPEVAARLGISKVFLVGRWTYYTVGGLDGTRMLLSTGELESHSLQDSTRAFADGIKAIHALYGTKGIAAHIVLQTPNQLIDPFRAYRVAREPTAAELSELSVTTSAHLAYQNATNAIIRGTFRDGEVIDFTNSLCSGGICSIGTVDTSYYFDDDHLSDAGASRLVQAVRSLL